jgi:putative endonuclease
MWDDDDGWLGLRHGEPLLRRQVCRRDERSDPPRRPASRGSGSKHVADFAKTRCVYVEHHAEIGTAIAREKLVRKWRRELKFALIEANNPDWQDLWTTWFDSAAAQDQPSPLSSTG